MHILTVTNARAGVFIDGAHLYAASRHLQFDVDYKLLREFVAENVLLSTANYYAALVDTDEYSPLKPLTDWLAYNTTSLKP